MISFRYHIVSLIAVFLALALGIVVGTTALNGPITTDLRNQVHSLEKNQTQLTQKANALQAQANQSQRFATTYGGQVVKGVLTDQKVLVIGLPGADSGIKNGIDSDIAAAGGQVVGQIQLTSSYIDPKRATDLNSQVSNLHPLGLTLPQTSDVGIVAGKLLAWVLVGNGKDTDLTQVIAGLSAGSYLKVDNGKDPHPTRSIVVVGSGTLPDNDSGGKMELALINQLQDAGAHVVVAGDSAAATGGGVVALVRSDDSAKGAVSTVDNADTAVGQVSTVIALAEVQTSQVGHYGTGNGAKSLFPDPVPAK